MAGGWRIVVFCRLVANKRAGRDSGFTLVEITVALVIWGILFSAAVLSMDSILARQRAYSAACRLAAEVRYVRQMAVDGDGRRVGLRFIEDPPGYELVRLVPVALPGGTVIYHLRPEGDRVNLPPGVRYAAVPFYDALYGKLLRFSDRGAPIPGGGEVVLADSFGRQYRVVILPATGYVRVTG